mgnify:CR=1 FL=1
MTKELLPPKNFRQIIPRCCATCRYLYNDGEGAFVCQRAPDVIVFDVGDRNDLLAVCDRWADGYRFDKA